MPLISILLPVFNEDCAYLEQSLQSIKRQTLRAWECIIILESTTDENKHLIEKICRNDERFYICIPEVRLGLPASLNLGAKLASADLIARMDSDDIMLPQRLEEQFNYLNKNPDVSVVGANYELINYQGKKIGHRRYPTGGFLLVLYFQFRCGLAHPCVMFRKSDFISLSGYDIRLNYCEDLDLWLRYLQNGLKIRNINKNLLRYRQSNRKKEHWKNMITVRLNNIMRRLNVRN